LINSFKQWWNADVCFVSSSKWNEHASQLQSEDGVQCFRCLPNRTSDIEQILNQTNPDVVVFDRFLAEEQFSFHVHRVLPSALRILDTQDIHSWRRARHSVIKSGGSVTDSFNATPCVSQPDYLRELASIHRSDLTLVCGSAEMHLLKTQPMVPASKLAMAPFFTDLKNMPDKLPTYWNRHNFVSIGNFHHKPNLDSLQWLLQSGMWHRIRQRLPQAEMHIYGAYAPPDFGGVIAGSDGVVMKGYMEDLRQLQTYRVLLSPLRFGAGVKGKVVDCWNQGTPVVTTPIGSESMAPSHQDWGGAASCVDEQELESAAVELYSDAASWDRAQANGFRLLHHLYSASSNVDSLRSQLESHLASLSTRRAEDHYQAVLWHQSLRSTKYFSRWIELKEKTAQTAAP
jgi:hypothetical protein